jgi:hypothetical protein
LGRCRVGGVKMRTQPIYGGAESGSDCSDDASLGGRTPPQIRNVAGSMGHSSMRAALIYQHATSERDREIASGMDKRIAAAQGKAAQGKPAKKTRKTKRRKDGDDPDGTLARVG